MLSGGCYSELVARDFSKQGEQDLSGWHALPFEDVNLTKEGLSIGRATFSVPAVLGSEFVLKISLEADLEGKDLSEFGICLSEGKVYMSPLGRNAIIRTQSMGGVGEFEAYSVNFVVKEQVYAKGAELLPGFRKQGSNTITVWKKGLEFGWNVNGKKSETFTLPTQLAAEVYVHFNFNSGASGDEALIIKKINVTGPKDSATPW